MGIELGRDSELEGERACCRVILDRLFDRCGIEFALYRMGTIQRRMARRMSATGSGSCDVYAAYLEDHPEEYERLLNDLTIKVSRFFRNEHFFEAFSRELLPQLLGRNSVEGRRSLRVWCAGCACGEEVYSTAICIMEYLRAIGGRVADFRIGIFGTDIDRSALDSARAGEYSAHALREARPEVVRQYFECIRTPLPWGRQGRESVLYRVIEPVKALVHFSLHDMASRGRRSPAAGVFSNYDVVLCRNVLIYFSGELQRRALSNIAASLNPGGFLVLGKSESVPEEFEGCFYLMDSSARIYRKTGR